MDHILITGGAGYIGAFTNKLLTARGYKTIVLDNLSRGHREFLRWGRFIHGDAGDRALLDGVFADHTVSAVMHFSSFINVGESVERPDLYYRNNVGQTLELLEAMKDHGVSHFLFSSSAAVYGIPEESPIGEHHPTLPINPYGQSKLMVENILGDFGRAYDFHSTSLRYFNAAGGDPEGELGEWHQPETHLIPLVLDAAAGRSEAVRVHGTDYPTPDGTCIRDYIHIFDLAEAHILALEHLLAEGGCHVLNLGNGRGFSVREVVQTARRVTGRTIPVIEGDRRPGDPPALVAGSKRAGEVLGWAPAIPELEDIIATAWNWHSRLDGRR